MSKNYKVILEYDGSRYSGWQKQGNTADTIQGKLEEILQQIIGKKVEVHGSGRTDAGVHALGQVANFHCDGCQVQTLQAELNAALPSDIRVLSCEEASWRFHSRLWAAQKTYAYHIGLAEKASVFQRKYVYTLGRQLDLRLMREAADYLLGKHDFLGFSSLKKSKKSTMRALTAIDFVVNQEELVIRYCGDGFLYNMVRILTGTLIEVGLRERTPQSIIAVLEQKDRQLAGFTAPPEGLFLEQVVYAPQTEINSGQNRSGEEQ